MIVKVVLIIFGSLYFLLSYGFFRRFKREMNNGAVSCVVKRPDFIMIRIFKLVLLTIFLHLLNDAYIHLGIGWLFDFVMVLGLVFLIEFVLLDKLNEKLIRKPVNAALLAKL